MLPNVYELLANRGANRLHRNASSGFVRQDSFPLEPFHVCVHHALVAVSLGVVDGHRGGLLFVCPVIYKNTNRDYSVASKFVFSPQIWAHIAAHMRGCIGTFTWLMIEPVEETYG